MSRSHRPSVGPDRTAWKKGPVLVSNPERPPVNVFGDPNAFRVADSWRMFVRTGCPDSGRRCLPPPLH